MWAHVRTFRCGLLLYVYWDFFGVNEDNARKAEKCDIDDGFAGAAATAYCKANMILLAIRVLSAVYGQHG